MKHIHVKMTRATFFIILLAISLLQFKISFFEQSNFSSPKKSSALWRQQINPVSLTTSANNAYLFQGESQKALAMLQRALTFNPLYIPAWIALGELKLHQGSKSEAQSILDHIDTLMDEVGRWRWQKTMLAYQLGDLEMLARDLDYVIDKLPGLRRKALDLASSLWPETEILPTKIGKHNLLHLFRYSLHPERLDKAIVYWPGVRVNQDLERRHKLYFIELLRRQGDITLAHTIWQEELETTTILHNGSFINKPLQTAFGWRIGKSAGTTWELLSKTESARGAFHLHFDGSKNVNYYHLKQHFSLTPDSSYTLSGEVRCENLTTDQRPYIEIIGVNAKKPRQKTAMFAATQSWQQFTLDFTVPSDCQQVYVRLRRNKSYYINNLIAGDLWLSNLAITSNELIDD